MVRWAAPQEEGLRPNGHQRHRNKKHVQRQPRQAVHTPDNTHSAHCTLRRTGRWANILLGAKEALLPAPLLTAQLWLVKATGAVLRAPCGSPLYAEWRTHRNPSTFQGHLKQISSRTRQYSLSRDIAAFPGGERCSKHLLCPACPRAAQLLFGRSQECYDLAWNKRDDVEQAGLHMCHVRLTLVKSHCLPMGGTGMVEQVTLGCKMTGRLRKASCSLEPLILEGIWWWHFTVCLVLSQLEQALAFHEWFSTKRIQVTSLLILEWPLPYCRGHFLLRKST